MSDSAINIHKAATGCVTNGAKKIFTLLKEEKQIKKKNMKNSVRNKNKNHILW